jgi:membrane fusion protein (multidrug efflux system)
MTKRRTCILIGVSIALLATGVLAATKFQQTTAAADEAHTEGREKQNQTGDVWISEIKPANVKVAPVSADSLSEWVTANGITQPVKDVTYSAEIPGRVAYVGAELGQVVQKGQVLARIDLDSLKAQKNRAEANFALAGTTHGRLNALGADMVSSQKLDEARYALTSAKAEFVIASDNLKKGAVRAGRGGVVSAKYVEKGEYVSPGTPLFRIVDHRTIIVEARLPETQVATVQKSGAVTVTVGALNREFAGTVDAVLPAADKTSRMFTVRVKVENKDLEILVGMSAVVRAPTSVHSEVAVVPRDVIIEGKDGSRVFVSRNGVAQERPVRLGAVEGNRVVVLDGLKPGDELIVTGHRELIHGQPLNVIR